MPQIIFPEDCRTEFIRPIKDTKDDYTALAKCYNTFKDSDSWPEGFGGSLVFTSELVEKELRNKDLSAHFIVKNPDNPNDIVGVGFCNKMWNLPNGWYVMFLGVDPSFQKQKFGRALLWNATKFATEQNAQLITLHTWPGNIKAMPLYKKQGYKWRPKTEVYMENYIPQILNYSPFSDFFSKYCWYDVFKPIITQEPNDEFEGKMEIYEYQFSADQNRLSIWIDRTIGRISGFHKQTSEGEDFLIKAQTPNSKTYIGFEEFPITLQLKNNGSTAKLLSIKAIPSSSIVFKGNKEVNIELLPNSGKIIEFKGQIKAGTDELDTKIHTQTYSDHSIAFSVIDGKSEYQITIGKVPINAIKVLPDPLNFIVPADSELDLTLKLQNAMIEDKEVELTVLDGSSITFKEHSFKTKVLAYDSSIQIPMSISNTSTEVDLIKTVVKDKDGKTLIERDLPIVIFNINKALSYEFEQQLFIENKNVRIELYKASQPGNNEVRIIDKLRMIKINGHRIILGYPFDDEGSEFYTLDLSHQVIEAHNGIWLFSSAESKVKPGIIVTRKIFVPDDDEPLGISWEIENTSKQTFFEDLGILVSPFVWGHPPLKQYVYPFQEGIRHVNIYELPINLGMDPKSFIEGWKATEYSEGTIGILFDHQDPNIDKIEISHHFLRFELKTKKKLNSGEKYEFPPVWYVFTENWQRVRKFWQDKYEYSPSNQYVSNQPSSSHKQFGFLTEGFGTNVYQSLFVDEAKPQEIKIGIDAFRKTTFKGEIKINFKDAITTPNEITLPEENKQLWSQKVEIKPITSRQIINGIFTFDSHTRIHNRQLAIGLYSSSKDVNITEKKDYIVVDNGFLTYKGSANYSGTVFYFSLNEDKENLLLTHYPELLSFLWWNQFFGGIRSLIRPEHDWGETDYNKLNFEVFKIEKGLWKGIGFKSDIIDYSPHIKGLQNSTYFLTLPDSPFLLVQQVIHNHSGVVRHFDAHIRVAFQTSNSAEDSYFVRVLDGSIAKYKTQDYESRVYLEKDPHSSWAAYLKHGSKYYIAALLPSTRQHKESIGPYAPNFSLFMKNLSARGNRIRPQETKTFNMLLFLTDDLMKIEPFTNSNLKETLEGHF